MGLLSAKLLQTTRTQVARDVTVLALDVVNPPSPFYTLDFPLPSREEEADAK